MVKQEIKARLVNLNNKGRKGDYVYITSKNTPPRYFKVSDESMLDPYVLYYKKRYVQKDEKVKGISVKKFVKRFAQVEQKGYRKISGKRSAMTKSVDRYVQKIKKSGTLESNVKRGIIKGIIPNALTINSFELDKVKKQMFKNQVLDKGLLDVIILEENMKKMKNRFEHRIEFLTENNRLVGTTKGFLKSPSEVVDDIRKIVSGGIREVSYRSPELADKLKERKGYTKYIHKNNGLIKKVKITMLFRKAK